MSTIQKINGFDCLYTNKSGSYFYNTPTNKRLPSGGYKHKLIKLKAENPPDAVLEISKKKLHMKSKTLSKHQKFNKIRDLRKASQRYRERHGAFEKLKSVIGFFSWAPFQRLKYRISRDVENLEFKNGVMKFNFRWINGASEISIIQKVRGFVRREAR